MEPRYIPSLSMCVPFVLWIFFWIFLVDLFWIFFKMFFVFWLWSLAIFSHSPFVYPSFFFQIDILVEFLVIALYILILALFSRKIRVQSAITVVSEPKSEYKVQSQPRSILSLSIYFQFFFEFFFWTRFVFGLLSLATSFCSQWWVLVCFFVKIRFTKSL